LTVWLRGNSRYATPLANAAVFRHATPRRNRADQIDLEIRFQIGVDIAFDGGVRCREVRSCSAQDCS
jgi:hypothetical protein